MTITKMNSTQIYMILFKFLKGVKQMVKLFEAPKIYFINGILATMNDLKRLKFDYLTKNIEILEIKHNAYICWLKTN